MFELVVAVFLILLNGVFALSELAVVSARKGRLRALAEEGRTGARAALSLADNPGKFLSTVQIGITLIGILAGAFSGAALGGRLTDMLLDRGAPLWLAEPLGYGVVIVVITYLSVVVGELVPKQLALRNAESIACLVAPPMTLLSRIGAPPVWLLDASTRLVFHLLGQKAASDRAVTGDELRSLVAEAEAAGVIENSERDMISGVLRLGDRTARSLMTPRTEVDWINLAESEGVIRAKLIASPHSRLPVGERGTDDLLGVVQSRDVLAAILAGRTLDLRAFLRTAPIVPDSIDALAVLETLRAAEVPMLLVHDEYGHFEGIVTPADVLEAIAGVFRSSDGEEDEQAVQRQDGTWLLAGSMPAYEMAERLGLSLPERRGFQTVAGLVIAEMRHLPKTGEIVIVGDWRLEVVDLDGRRVDKVLASRVG
ncbi:hemolysin family protein [Lichenihabitans psoromatis]|uniref:hemolysin family protein n=1 Tax=Lichenihabitans psoromatis TaxID=2528642 RepID=UPI0010368EE6|nr:hemolysin family protein [Lichenihabitans psoromatis]